MSYTLTSDHHNWLNSMGGLQPNPSTILTQTNNWLRAHSSGSTVTNANLNEMVTDYEAQPNASYAQQVNDWSLWVKGGVRPQDPH